MATVRELVTKILFKIDDKKLKAAEKSINRFKKSTLDIGKKLSTFVTLPILGLGVAMTKAASDAEESESKFATIFKSISAESESTAQNLAKNFGLSQLAAKKLLGDTGDLLTGFGFSQDQALELSNSVNELAVDLASFTNFAGGAEGASSALTKALLGERESVKSLGISIQEEDVKKQIAINKSKGLRFETVRQAKAMATLQLAQAQSKNAIGDFARTSGGAANQARILKAKISDLSISFGKILLPIANKIIGKLIILAEKFTSLSETNKEFILIAAAAAATLGPLLIIIGHLAGAIGNLIWLYGKLAPLATLANLAMFGWIIAGIALIGGLIYGIKKLIDNWAKVKLWLSDITIDFIDFGFAVTKYMLTPLQTVIDAMNKIRSLVGLKPIDINVNASLDKVSEYFKKNVAGQSISRDVSSVGLGTFGKAGQNNNFDTKITVNAKTDASADEIASSVFDGWEEKMNRKLRAMNRDFSPVGG